MAVLASGRLPETLRAVSSMVLCFGDRSLPTVKQEIAGINSALLIFSSGMHFLPREHEFIDLCHINSF
ncbi:MAG: hypothetical protein ACI8WM_002201 [Burkholderiaceae bacterium]|jgi:hypothetical protein